MTRGRASIARRALLVLAGCMATGLQAGDGIVWDNWRTIHCATGVPFDVERLAQRTTLVGDYKLGRYLNPEDRHDGPRRKFDD